MKFNDYFFLYLKKFPYSIIFPKNISRVKLKKIVQEDSLLQNWTIKRIFKDFAKSHDNSKKICIIWLFIKKSLKSISSTKLYKKIDFSIKFLKIHEKPWKIVIIVHNCINSNSQFLNSYLNCNFLFLWKIVNFETFFSKWITSPSWRISRERIRKETQAFLPSCKSFFHGIFFLFFKRARGLETGNSEVIREIKEIRKQRNWRRDSVLRTPKRVYIKKKRMKQKANFPKMAEFHAQKSGSTSEKEVYV